MSESLRWTVLVPMRMLPAAKGRLAAGLTAEVHTELVRAIRADTLAAVRAAPPVARIVVVADEPGMDGGGLVLVQRSAGLNGALRDGARHARQNWPADGVAALVGDVPALRPEELSAALVLAAVHRAAYVPDAAGTGTTLLTAAPGRRLDPRFGAGSADRHGRRAVRIDAGPGLRHDVDTLPDLAAAAGLGVGPRTAAVLPAAGLTDCTPAVHLEGA